MVFWIGVYVLVHREPNWISWGLVLFFGGSAFVFAMELFDTNPRLKISEKGIYVPYWSVGTIAWTDIRGVFVRTEGDSTYLCFSLHSPENFRARMNKATRVFHAATKATGFGDFSMKPSENGLAADVVLELVQAQLDRDRT